MAIVRVDFSHGQPDHFPSTISMTINSVMTEVLGVPPQENYIICQSHDVKNLFHSSENFSRDRLQKIAFIQITLNQGRSAELKTKFFAELNKKIINTGLLEKENIFINLVEVARENWSFGSFK